VINQIITYFGCQDGNGPSSPHSQCGTSL
jgi:hypothetical protein